MPKKATRSQSVAKSSDLPDPKQRKRNNALFVSAFSNPDLAAFLLQAILPQHLLALLDLPKLSVQSVPGIGSALDENAHDIIYAVPWLDGTSSLRVYLALEHQSKSFPFMALRCLEYCLLILKHHQHQNKKHKRLPLVLPLVLHIGKSGWHAPRKLSQLQEAPPEIWKLYGEFLPECGYFLIDLSPRKGGKLPDDPIARAVLLLLQAEKEGNLMEKTGEIFGELGAHPSVRKFRDTLGKMFEFVLQKNPLQREEIMGRLKTEISKPVEEIMLSTYDQLINEGIEIGFEKGIEKGIEKGRQEGRQEERVASRIEMLFDALKVKFGKVPQKVAASIRRISESDRLQELLLVAIRSNDIKEFSSHLR